MRSPAPASQADAEDISRLVEAERVALLYRLTPPTMATAAIFSTVMVVLLQPAIPLNMLLGWWLATNLNSLMRYLLARAYRRAAPGPDQADLWFRRFVALAFIAGVAWGMLGTVLYPQDNPPFQAIVCVILVGVCSVGLFALSSSAAAFAVVAVPMLLPSAAFLLLLREGGETLLGTAMGFFLLIALTYARRGQANTEELLQLRFQNARIAQEREHALEGANAASRAKSQFLANMSHEMRTPLNGILGMAQLLDHGQLDPVQKQRLGTLYQSSRHLLVLINDVLDFSKIEAGKLELDVAPFNLRTTIRETSELLRPGAWAKQLAFNVNVEDGIPEWVMGDTVRVKQVLNNLLGNAIKFTDKGAIDVHVAPHPEKAHFIRFEVRDTGIGIDKSEHASLFEVFSQADSSHARKHGGTGLGLAISLQLSRLMHGDIDFVSQPGLGSTFWFDAPLAACEAPTNAADGAAPLAPLSGRILLVEDSPINREVALAVLRHFGVAVQSVEDGQQAVDITRNARFDLILMDCQMPNVDGFEATRRIRTRELSQSLPRTPIVALTANALEGDRARCFAAGMDDYLAKPFFEEQLHAVLKRWLSASN